MILVYILDLVTVFSYFVNLTDAEVPASGKYEANWKSLDSRPLPSWFDEAKFGISLHWGVYSVPSFHSEWFWYFMSGELAEAVREKNLRFGIHHALEEWFHPLYQMDKKNNFSTRNFVTEKLIPEMIEVVEIYKPSIVWANGYQLGSDEYWGSKDFLAWLYNESPVKDVVVTNDQWGKEALCRHGGFITCPQNYRKWEADIRIDQKSWAFRRNARLDDYLSTYQLIEILSRTVSNGGNFRLNIGPTKDGIIAPIFQERLRDLGEWLEVNGEAIYGTKQWSAQKDASTSKVWYTAKGTAVYAIVLFWPDCNVLELASANTILKDNKVQVSMLGRQGNLRWASGTTKAKIFFPDKSTVRTSHAYVLKFQKGSCPSKC